jgi:thioredoxin-like negative regulator of GroEL
MNIQSIPTLMIFRDGIGVFSQAGALPRRAVDDLIEQVRALDMDAVRAEIAASSGATASAAAE